MWGLFLYPPTKAQEAQEAQEVEEEAQEEVFSKAQKEKWEQLRTRWQEWRKEGRAIAEQRASLRKEWREEEDFEEDFYAPEVIFIPLVLPREDTFMPWGFMPPQFMKKYRHMYRTEEKGSRSIRKRRREIRKRRHEHMHEH